MKPVLRDLVLVRAEPGQAAALSELAFAAKASHGYGPELMAGWREDLSVTAGYLRSQFVWTVRVEDELAGWGGTVGWGRRCRLEHLWIAPSQQGQGIGRILLYHLLVEARAAGWKELEIVSDPFAAGFYQRCGAYSAGVETLPGGRQLPLLLLPIWQGCVAAQS